jgi:pimeloyl-ACP methyl ester carboxylesterase
MMRASQGLHVVEAGPPAAPLVVLVHGTMDRSSGFSRTARLLEDRYRVLRYDRRGYARSGGLAGPFGCQDHVDDLLGLLEGRRATVVGHSYGANVALAASVQAPSLVHAVGAYELPMPWEAWWPGTTAGSAAVAASREGGPEDAAEQFLRRLLGDHVWARLPAATREARRAEGHTLVAEMVDIRSRAPWRVEQLTAPLVVGHGTRSAAHHQEGVRWLASKVAGSELVVIDGASHGAHLSHPRAFAGLVDRTVEAGDRRAASTGEDPAS